MHETRVLVSELLEMMAGPILWLAHLLAVYGATALVCAERLPIESGGAALAVGAGSVTVLAIAVSGWLLVRALREQANPAESGARRFVNRATIALSGFAVIAITWTGLPVLLAPGCAPPGLASRGGGGPPPVRSAQLVQVGGDVARLLLVEPDRGHRGAGRERARILHPAHQVLRRVRGAAADVGAQREAIERRADHAAGAAHARDVVAGAARVAGDQRAAALGVAAGAGGNRLGTTRAREREERRSERLQRRAAPAHRGGLGSSGVRSDWTYAVSRQIRSSGSIVPQAGMPYARPCAIESKIAASSAP